jgi:uncharacterized caspase-like protein
LPEPVRIVALIEIMSRTGSAWISAALAIALLAATAICPPSALAAEPRVALVIGNSAYPAARLPNAANDARAMAAKLRTLGFDVILKTDASQREMTRSFSEFGRKLVPGSVSLFYFAGHGMQVRGKNFLIPVDAEIDNEASVRSEAVEVDQVFDHLGSAKLSMVILDACRNNPFEQRFRSGAGSGLAQIDAPTGTLLAYATAPGKVAADGNGDNGLYTAELLKAIDTQGIRIEDVFKQVRINVLKASGNQQIPWESSSLTGEFYFRPATNAPADDKLALQQAAQVQAELQKALQEERAKRAQETLAVKEEMEKLRAEMLRLKEWSAQAGDDPPAGDLNAAFATEWAPRLALLTEARDGLTLSKALAILLDITNDEELSLLLTHEGKIRRNEWNNAYAMGTDSQGGLIWGGAYRLRNETFAADTALEQCAAGAGESCKVLVINGAFQEKVFIEMARQLGSKSITAARQSFLKSLTAMPRETRVGFAAGQATGGIDSAWAIGYSSTREKSAAPAPRTSPPGRLNTAYAAEWAPRLALIGEIKDEPNLAKALAVLLDVRNEQDVALLLNHMAETRTKAWHNGYALGVSARGILIWGGAYRMRNAVDAGQAAVEQCIKGPGDACKAIVVNGDFVQGEFQEVAKQLGAQSVAAVRRAYLASLEKKAAESRLGISSGGGGQCNGDSCFSYGYSPAR